jgi:hypothetical protein
MRNHNVSSDDRGATAIDIGGWARLVEAYSPALLAAAERISACAEVQRQACELAWLRLAQHHRAMPEQVLAWLLDQVALEVRRLTADAPLTAVTS